MELVIPKDFIGRWHGDIDDSRRPSAPYPGEIVFANDGVRPYYGQKIIKTWGELKFIDKDLNTLRFNESTFKAEYGKKCLTWSGTVKFVLENSGRRLKCIWLLAESQVCEATMVKIETQSAFVSEIKQCIKSLD